MAVHEGDKVGTPTMPDGRLFPAPTPFIEPPETGINELGAPFTGLLGLSST